MSDALEQVHALVDGELSPDQREQVLSAISHDPQLGREFAWAQAVKDLVRAKCTNEMEAGEWQAAKARIKELDRVKTTNHLVTKYAGWIAGVCMVGILAAGYMGRTRSYMPSENKAVISSVFESPLQFNNSRVETLPNTPDYRFPPFHDDLVLNAQHGEAFYDVHYGGLDGHQVACVRMSDSRGPLWVYAIKGVNAVNGIDEPYGDMRLGFVRALPCVSYQQNGYLVVVMADRNVDQLVDAANGVRNKQ